MTAKKLTTARKFHVDTKEKLLDRMLLALHDALWLDQCLFWTARGVSNLHYSETLPLAKYFVRGMAVGDKPMFDGMCAFCACLLVSKTSSAVYDNRRWGPPMNRHGEKQTLENGQPDTSCQPPCLLRYSPSLFAKEAPALFEHDPNTNRLKLKPGQEAPWLRQNPPAGDPNTWQFCVAAGKLSERFVTNYCLVVHCMIR